MPNYGVFITKEKKDVTKPQPVLNYILNSNYNTFKIYKIFNGSLAVPLSGSANTLIPHGLGYYPAFLAYYRLKKASQSWWIDQTSLNSNIPENDDYRCATQINTEVVRVQAEDGASQGATDIEYKVFIFIDPIDLVGTNITGASRIQDFGFKISKPGVDVIQAKTHELLITSRYDSLKFHMEEQLSITFTDTDTFKEVSFQHGLGYIPMFLAVVDDTNDSTKQRLIPHGRVPQGYATSVRADKSTITVSTVFIGGVAFTDNYRVIVFKNKLADA